MTDIPSRQMGRHPVAPDGPTYSWSPQGLGIEVSASRGAKSKFSRAIAIIGEQTIPCILELFGGRLKRFDPAHYKLETMQNTDFRKYDDGLKLTVDCKTGTITEIEKILSTAQEAGTAFFGLYRQDSAVMTCIIPSPFTNDHMHFVDGGSGGYALAAVQLKKPSRQPANKPKALDVVFEPVHQHRHLMYPAVMGTMHRATFLGVIVDMQRLVFSTDLVKELLGAFNIHQLVH